MMIWRGLLSEMCYRESRAKRLACLAIKAFVGDTDPD
jgi:hypothetical protein